MKNFAGKLALVTGAGSGIGRATAVALADEGARIAVTDINPESARATARNIADSGGEAQAFELDVAQPAQIEQVADDVERSMGVPSILVNNAGIAVGGEFLDTSAENWQRVIAVNLVGLVDCCRVFIPRMVAGENGGHVVNIASMLGYTAARGVSAYCTTKFGVLGFSECLRAELGSHGIGVSVICPGIVATNIIQSSHLESTQYDVEEKREAIQAVYENRNYPPERVAKVIIRAIRKNRGVVPVTREAWFSYYLKRFAPGISGLIAKRDFV